MFIILQKIPGISDKVLNVIYGEEDAYAKKWISEYLISQIDSLAMCPAFTCQKYVSYVVESKECGDMALVKKYKKVHKGYIYNTSKLVSEELMKIAILEFDGDNILFQVEKCLDYEITNEINKRVIKQLDKESLCQVFSRVHNRVETKKHWNSYEFTGLVSEVIKNFKKELYSSIVKKLKRFGNKSFEKVNLPCHVEASIDLDLD